jgi:hypothetical protein
VSDERADKDRDRKPAEQSHKDEGGPVQAGIVAYDPVGRNGPEGSFAGWARPTSGHRGFAARAT